LSTLPVKAGKPRQTVERLADRVETRQCDLKR
jgi:hypothetical protein